MAKLLVREKSTVNIAAQSMMSAKWMMGLLCPSSTSRLTLHQVLHLSLLYCVDKRLRTSKEMRNVVMFAVIARRSCKASLVLTSKVLFYGSFASNMSNKVEEIIDFWFRPGHVAWFGGGEAANTVIREKYGDLVEAAFEGKLQEWKDEPRASLALILICDQFCRNVNQGTKRMTGLDPIALEVAQKFIEQKTHNHLDMSFFERTFIYLPFEHSEDRANQELSVKLFTQLADDAKTPDEKKAGEEFVMYAKHHKEIIDKFGRYPQRNAMLGRENTPEEAEFLANLPSKYKW